MAVNQEKPGEMPQAEPQNIKTATRLPEARILWERKASGMDARTPTTAWSRRWTKRVPVSRQIRQRSVN
jgi:hypothetical protein